MKKQNIFIDFDGTICFDYFWRSSPEKIKGTIVEFLFQNNTYLLEDWMRGQKSSEDINKIISTECNLDYNMIWKYFVKDCENMYVAEDVLSAISSCRKNNTLILITDNMDSFNRFTRDKLKLTEYFDYIFNSCDYGLLKDDPIQKGLFKKVIDIHNFDIKKSVLLDNSKKNCDLFSELGGESFLVKDKQDVISILKMLG